MRENLPVLPLNILNTVKSFLRTAKSTLRNVNIARVSVHDEGPGIAPEEQELLWGRFYRGKGSVVQHELDLSLGLRFYLCQALIEHHHGNTGVQSTPGHGTTFWFTVPMARPAGA